MSVSRNGGYEQFADGDLSLDQTADFTGWYRRGEALANLGHYAEALRYFEEALSLDSRDADTLVYTAVCLIHLQRPQEALERCDRILSQYPDHSQAWMFRGVALQRLGQYRKAYTAYDRVTDSPAVSPQRQFSHSLRSKLAQLGILF